MSDIDDPGDTFGFGWSRDVYLSCGLCRFFFEDKESVVIFNSKCAARVVEFESSDVLLNKAEKRYHVDCVELATPDLMTGAQLDPDIWSATVHNTYLYDDERPSTPWVERRAKRLRNLFTPKLYDALQFRLPFELCQDIAQHLTRESAVLALRDVWLGGLHRDRSEVGVTVKESTTLYIGYIEIEGLRYVNYFSSALNAEASVTEVTFNKGLPVNIFIANDYLGVRNIIFLPPGEQPDIDREPGVMWSIDRMKSLPFLITGRFDASLPPWVDTSTPPILTIEQGLKLRHLDVFTPDEYSQYESHGYVKEGRQDNNFRRFKWPVIPKLSTLFPKIDPILCDGSFVGYDTTLRAID
ncbi:hypothetical protein FHETE_3611 [Fusarium heterosporum]|uniref:Uncharacterized protein n=1 Tax=Fusarium heterosporum TaxID=42747 RepID=A0A8H5TNP6_FUSHE|nr:hypothetical protein FHETE_3611 [Fusarium heterosporum]